MRNKTKAMVAIAVLAAAMVAAASLRTYTIVEGGGGYALWNAHEAYLFISVSQKGYHCSYLKYPLEVIGEYLYAVPLPDDNLRSFMVIRITPSTVERHLVDLKGIAPGSGPDLYTPFEDRIYANCPDLGGLCRWAGDQFERATEEEQRKLDGINRLIQKDIDNVNGWSKQGFGPGPINNKVTIKPNDKFELSVANLAADGSGYGAVSVDLLRPSQAPERICYLDGHPRRVNKAKYEHVFGRR
jgi:hypothetical protein